jgi:hypothetical protein
MIVVQTRLCWRFRLFPCQFLRWCVNVFKFCQHRKSCLKFLSEFRFWVGCFTWPLNETENVLDHHKIICFFSQRKYLYHHGVKKNYNLVLYGCHISFVKMGKGKKIKFNKIYIFIYYANFKYIVVWIWRECFNMLSPHGGLF